MGKHYDELRRKCPCDYCRTEKIPASPDVRTGEHATCITPSPMEAFESVMSSLKETQAEFSRWIRVYGNV